MRPVNVSSTKAIDYYYALDPFFSHKESQWAGAIRQAMGLSERITKDEFSKVLQGQDMKGNQIIKNGHGKDSKKQYQSKHRAAIDIALSAPKSVSITALHCGHNKIIEAHQNAVQQTITEIEQEFIKARETKTGKTQVIDASGLFATFNHSTSRANDPQLHTHVLIMNMCIAGNKYKAVFNDLIYKNQRYINNYYQQSLASELMKAGYQIEIQKNGNFEIKGVSEKVIKQFSKRTDEIEKQLRQMSDSQLNEAQRRNKATIESRQDKDRTIDKAQLKAKWEQEHSSKKIENKIKYGHTKSKKAIGIIQNAANLSGIEYIDDIELKQGMSRLKILIFDNQACSEANKYYVFVFLLATFLVDFINAKGILKASGDTSSGKTTAARLLTCLLFKKDMTSTGTVASYYTEAATSPMLIMDNLESKDITTALLNFILIVATGGQRIKRSKDSQTANVYEKPNTQIFWSAIEPPEKEETLNRTIDIEFSRKYWNDIFSETETMELIKEERNQLLSTIFKLIAFKILPDFTEKRKKAQTWIKNKYKGHAKERLNELLATYLVILKEVCVYIPYSRQEESTPAHMIIFNQWIETQNEIAKHTAMNTNPILRYLGYLLKYYTYYKSDFENDFPEIQVEEELTDRAKFDVSVKEFKQISFDFTYSDLLAFIGRESKRIGEKNPFGTAAQLRYRLKNSQKILQDANWIYEGESKRTSQSRYYRITKVFEIEKDPF
jgi:conjugative relaxase-like TrwC/TraI family protein